MFDWGDDKLIWLDKRIKLYIGLKLPTGTVEYVPQGVFVMTEFQNEHSLNGKTTSITGYDKTFLMVDKRGKFTYDTTLEKGINLGLAIKTIAEGAGETLFNFDTVTETLPYEITYQADDNRWKAIEELALLAKCQVFYDVHGYLRLKKIDLNYFETEPVQWSYKYGDPNERFYAGNVRRIDDGNLANHVKVLGGSGQTATCSYQLVVDKNDPLWKDSPYTVQRIGRLIYSHNNGNPDSLLTTEDECKWRAKYELMRRLGYAERVSLSLSPNFLHDVGDVIEIIDSNNAVSGKYLIESMNIPLNIALMSCECVKYKRVIQDWNFI